MSKRISNLNWLLLTVLVFVSHISCTGQPKKLPDVDYNAFREDATLTVDDIERSFIVQKPSHYTGETALPVVFMFHGTSGTGDKFWRISRWKELGEKEGIITVYPTALKYKYEEDGQPKNKTKWNDGKLETYINPGQILADDIKFVREIIDYLAENYSIDQNKLYASGFSNGANFAFRVAVDLSDKFAAVTAVAGQLALPEPKPEYLVPVYMVVGAADDGIIEKNGGEPLPHNPDELVNHDLFKEVLNNILTTFELSDTYTIKKGENHVSFKFEENTGSGDNEFIFSYVKGLEHRYPNGTNNPAGYIAAKHFWDNFYSKHEKNN